MGNFLFNFFSQVSSRWSSVSYIGLPEGYSGRILWGLVTFWWFLIAVEIAFYIVKYFIEKWILSIRFFLAKDSSWAEFKSFVFAVLISFLLYYLIAVELSVVLFGYSLLCYWFSAIFIIVCLILAWQLESNFLKTEMEEELDMPLITWIGYYKNENPLSFYDFLTGYEWRPFLQWTVISKYSSHIEDFWQTLLIFYSFIFFLFFYACVYRYNPYFVIFVAKYFHPIVNFFETRKVPWLEDFSSALIWFWNRLVMFLEAKYKNSDRVKRFKALTKSSPLLEAWAHAQRAHKTSLWNWARFSDIQFLKAARSSAPVSRLVFDLDQPSINGLRFDPNWKLFFLRYIAAQYSLHDQNFWQWHFTNNNSFWQLLDNLKNQVNREVNETEQWLFWSHMTDGTITANTFDLLLQYNYFEQNPVDTTKYADRYGSNRDFYFNLIWNSYVKRTSVLNNLEDIFTVPAYRRFPSTLAGFFKFQFENWWNPVLLQTAVSALDEWIRLFSSGFLQSPQVNIKEFYKSLKTPLEVSLDNYNTFEDILMKPTPTTEILFAKAIPNIQLYRIYIWSSWWMATIEHAAGLQPKHYYYRNGWFITLGFINNMLHSWLDRLDFFINDWGFSSFLNLWSPSYENIRYLYTWFFHPMIYFWFFWYHFLKGFKIKEEKLKALDAHLALPYKVSISWWELHSFLDAERRMRVLEQIYGLWIPTFLNSLDWKEKKYLEPVDQYPWYIWSLDYFNSTDTWPVLPGFIRYYYPTPFPFTFSTIGMQWNKYQYFRKNTMSTIVGYSDNLADLRSSTPLVLYSGVEAVLYIKPLLDVFDYIIKIFLNFINYPIEALINQNVFPIFSTITSLTFFVHLIWFMHFYIYALIFLYLFYYFLVFYFQRVGFQWFYEWTTEEIFLSSYSNRVFWFSLGDLWRQYQTPQQLFLLTLQTNLLLFYTFQHHCSFLFKEKKLFHPLVELFVRLMSTDLKNYSFFFSIFDWKKEIIYKNSPNFYMFWSFFNVVSLKYTSLVFEGGAAVSSDQLVWSYFDYLSQVSVYLSRGLWWNYYSLGNTSEFTALLKQLTILFSSNSPARNFLFMEQPLMDTALGWTLFTNFFIFLKNEKISKFLINGFFYKSKFDITPLLYSLVTGYWTDLLRFSTSSGLDIYSLFSHESLSFATKLHTATFWNDHWFWILAFFWSFWFSQKLKTGISLHPSYEQAWLHLARVAYSNSWLGQSTYTRPFFNLVQHLWWTSRLYTNASNLLFSPYNLNQLGIGVIDEVWNFMEKWYSFQSNAKVETIFGLVWGLKLSWSYYDELLGPLPYENRNFDLSFPLDAINKWTTDWSYLKTNPHLNLLELGIGPYEIFKIFETLPAPYLFTYLSFPFQLEFWNLQDPIILRNLTQEFLSFYNLSDYFYPEDVSLATKYSFFFKKFDFLLRTTDNVFQNLIFTFDVSYFLSHFTSWDYFTTCNTDLRPKYFSPSSERIMTSETLALWKSNWDMIAQLNHTDDWFKKPFGVLDKLEVHALKKFKTTKLLDVKSFTRNWEDIFLLPDWEYLRDLKGFATADKSNEKNLLISYDEEYLGERDGRFPANPNFIKNTPTLILLGWVGEIYSNTSASLNFLFSLQYANSFSSPDSWNEINKMEKKKHLGKARTLVTWTFFVPDKNHEILLSKAFTWLNFILHPCNFWWSLGPKAAAWLDFWSWKCSFMLDYTNGFYTYWPYVGFRHSFAAWMTSYDTTYGFYWTYRQIYDNPLIVDPSTSAFFHFKPVSEETLFEDIARAYTTSKYDYDTSYDPMLNIELAMPYREVYYSMQHPYFIGYLFFWFLIQSSKFLYLGFSNFSFWWFLVRELSYEIVGDVSLLVNSKEWTMVENWFRTHFSSYWKYFLNPIKLTSFADCFIDDNTLQPLALEDSMFKFLAKNIFLYDYLYNYVKLNFFEISFLLDFKILLNSSYCINWLALDIPFTLHPFLVVNFYNLPLFSSNIMLNLKFHTLNFSKFNTLKEVMNFNLFYDWSSGVFFDSINFVSYMSTVRGSGLIHSGFYENSSFIAASFVRFQKDKSKELAHDLIYQKNNPMYRDILTNIDLTFHNLALVHFFSDTLAFLTSLQSSRIKPMNIFFFLKFYITNSFSLDFWIIKLNHVPDLKSKIAADTNRWFSKLWELIFVYFLQRNLSTDILFSFFSTGLHFSNLSNLYLLFKSFRLWLSTRYTGQRLYYRRFGKLLSFFFFKKW